MAPLSILSISRAAYLIVSVDLTVRTPVVITSEIFIEKSSFGTVKWEALPISSDCLRRTGVQTGSCHLSAQIKRSGTGRPSTAGIAGVIDLLQKQKPGARLA